MTEEQLEKIFEVAAEDLRQKRKVNNEEWLRQCTTEQFAEWLRKHMNCNFCPMRLKCEDMRDCKTNIKWWLKQPHHLKG